MTLDNVYLEGQQNIEVSEVLTFFDRFIGEPILSIPIHKFQKEIEALEWVRYAMIERQFPNTIHVHIIERKPLALWQYKKEQALIDREGKKIEGADLNKFRYLVLLVGEDVPDHANTLLEVLYTKPEFAKKVSSAVRVGQRRWNIKFNSGTLVKMPEEDIAEAWNFLLQLNVKQKILDTSRSIDLRVPEKVYIQKKKSL